MLPDFSIYDAIASPVFVLTRSERGDIVYAFMNACGCRYLGRTPEEVVGKTAAQLFTGRAAETVYERQCAAWDGGVEASYDIPLGVGDETIWVSTRLVPQRDSAGTVTHLVGLSLDITATKTLEQEQTMIHALVDEMEDFVSFAAHDLRSPIANVKMLTDLVRDGFVDMGDGKLQMIDMIEDISERALDLVTDVLSQSTAARRDTAPTEFSFRDMCDNILATLDPAQQHQVTMPDAWVEADYPAVQIIVRNLIDNAIKHAGLDQVSLTLDVTHAQPGRIGLSVADNGKGFDERSLQAMKGAAASKSGFGLMGVRRLVHARGGQVSVSRGPYGTGTQIRLDLPGHIVSDTAGQSLKTAGG